MRSRRREPTAGSPGDGPRPIHLSPIGGHEPRRLELAVGVLAAIVVIAIVKPWGPGTPVPAAQPAAGTPPASFGSTRSSAPETPATAPSSYCEYAGGWRIASIERSSDSEWRAWKAIDPAVGVRRPVDPAIPFVEVIATSVLAVGYCAPSSGPDSPDLGASMVAWRLLEGKAEPLAVRELGSGMSTILGALFKPPDASGSWPAGRYVFRVGDYWLGAEVRQAVPRADSSASVSPSPTVPSPSASR